MIQLNFSNMLEIWQLCADNSAEKSKVSEFVLHSAYQSRNFQKSVTIYFLIGLAL